MHHLYALFSAGGSPDRHALAGCDVRVRLMVALAATVAVVMSTCGWFGLIALVCCVVGLAALGTSPKAFASRLLGPLALAAVVFLTRAFMTGTTPMASIELGVWHLTATREGVLGGALIACRVLGSVGIVMVLCQTTPTRGIVGRPELGQSAAHLDRNRRADVPLSLHPVGAGGLRRFGADGSAWDTAGCGDRFNRWASLAGIVILRSLDQAEKSHEAMMARGYRGRLPLARLAVIAAGAKGIASLG